jgi:hypothetical protein
VTTPSGSSPRGYVDRDEAARLFDGTADHIYQGDIFMNLELFVPRPGGRWDPVLGHAIVISHDCEYTKVAMSVDKPLLVAPLRELRVFSQAEAIRAGQAVQLWALPVAPPIDEEFVVDFRLIQPIAVSELREAPPWACLSMGVKEVLQGRLARFLFRSELDGDKG